MPPSTFSARRSTPASRVHRLDDLARLPRGRLEHRAGEVALGDVAGEAGDHAARVAAPVRREQAGERGHEVAAAVVLDRARQRLDLGRRADQPELVAEPLHQRAGDRDRALERVGRPARRRSCSRRWSAGRSPTAPARRRCSSAGSCRCRRCTWRRRRRSRSGRTAPRAGRPARPPPAGRRARRRPRRRPPSTGGSRAASPAARPSRRAATSSQSSVCEVHQHRAAGVRHVGEVAAGELPDRASCPSSRTAPRRPRRARAARRRGRAASGSSAPRSRSRAAARSGRGSGRCPASPPSSRDELVGARVLPVDRVVHRLAGRAVPHHGRLALVGDPERHRGRAASAAPCRARRVTTVTHVVPRSRRGSCSTQPGRGKMWLVLLLADRDDRAPRAVEHDAARGRRALVDRLRCSCSFTSPSPRDRAQVARDGAGAASRDVGDQSLRGAPSWHSRSIGPGDRRSRRR